MENSRDTSVWENVPGAFSSNGGADFQSVLEEICSVKGHEIDCARPSRWPNAGEIVADGFSLAWRVLDAQYWGVPQRRKRIFLVADLAGGSAGKILFESEGVSWYSAEGFRAWERAARSSEESSGAAGGAISICVNPQGNSGISITENRTLALMAQDHGHHPAVLYAAGFCTEHSARARSVGYGEETSPTLRAGTVPAAVYENHSQDTRYTGPLGVAPPVTSTYGMGGNNQPLVVENTPKTLKIHSGCDGGGNDHTLFVPKAYGVCSKESHAMRSGNPKSGFYEADTSRTLDGNGGNPSCNQGGIAVVALEGNGARPSHKGSGYSEDDVSFTLNATEQHAVAYGLDQAAFNQGKNALYDFTIEKKLEPTMVVKGPGAVGQPVYHSSKSSFHTRFTDDAAADTLVAVDFKDPPTVSEDPYYIVRRLTPTECARLQGFPDWWCGGLGRNEPTEEDIDFWSEVFETHRKVIGASSKPKTRNQIIKWIKNPHSDSAEYRMWGNGVALPCVIFVLSGIVFFDSRDARNDR